MKRLTLSFDNGPDPACTPQVLDLLAFLESGGKEDHKAFQK